MTYTDINFWLFFAWALAITIYVFHLDDEIDDKKHRIKSLTTLLWGNYDDIKRLRVRLEAVEIKQREQANGKDRNASDGTLSGGPDIQCSSGDTSTGGTDETKSEIGFKYQDEAPGTDTDPKRDTEKGT